MTQRKSRSYSRESNVSQGAKSITHNTQDLLNRFDSLRRQLQTNIDQTHKKFKDEYKNY